MRKLKLFTIIYSVGLLALSSCATKNDISDLQSQLDEIKNTQIASINTQISSINSSIISLSGVDTQIQGYIKALQEQAGNIEKAIEQLQGDGTSLKEQLKTINEQISELQKKDDELQKQISELKTYINSEIKSAKDWVNATFVTLEKYNATADALVVIQAAIEELKNTTGISQSDIDAAISAQDKKTLADIQSACDAIEIAYSKAISDAINASELSIKGWINTQLAGYYTIAQTDAKVSSTKTNLENQIATQKTYLEGLISLLESSAGAKIDENAAAIETIKEQIATINSNITSLSSTLTSEISKFNGTIESTKTEITTAYKNAISTAIETLDGKLTGEIASNVASINSRIDEEVSSINAVIDELKERVSTCEKDIKSIKNTIYSMQLDIEDLQAEIGKILARIQSVTFIPEYSDGRAVMTYTNNGTITPGTAELTYELKPAETAGELLKVWKNALSVEAIYTITKSAPEMAKLTIESVSVENGFLMLTVSGKGLKDEYFKSQCSASVRLCISDGNNDLATDYVQMVPWTTDVISFGDPNFKAYCVENFDTSGDGEITAEEAAAAKSINASLLGLTSLVGIEYFNNLESIDVSLNRLESIDLSHAQKLKEIEVNGNKLQSLNLSGLSAIETLNCSDNKLSNIDVSAAPHLKSLICSNNSIGSLNLLQSKELVELQCSGNGLSSLNLKNNPLIETLLCRKNSLSSLDVSKLSGLKMLDCSNNSLTSLNTYSNKELESLYCSSNSIASLGVEENSKLTVLDCSSNQLTSLNISRNSLLETINCANNKLERLDVSNNSALESVTCSGNPSMSKLWVKDASQKASLTIKKDDATAIAYNNGGIYIPDANLKKYLLALFDDDEDGEISILESENVQNVNCSGRGIADLTGLEVCPNLKYLNFNGNNVAVVELPNLQKLETIVAYGNPIKKLNVNNDIALTELYLQNVSTNALNNTVFSINAYDQAETLCLAFAGTRYTTLKLTNSTILKSYDIAENIQLTKLVASGNGLVTGVNLATLSVLTDLDLNACSLTSLNVDANRDLVNFDCSSNKIASLNVDNNIALVNFDCSDNLLTTLRVTNNTLLERIDSNHNNLKNLNVRQNLALKELNVSYNNDITTLSLYNNPNLETLLASYLSITSLDLSGNLNIQKVDCSYCKQLSTKLDFSKHNNIKELYVESCPIISLSIASSIPSLIGQYVCFPLSTGVIISADSLVKIISMTQTSTTWGPNQDETNAKNRTNGNENMQTIASRGIDKYPAFQWCQSIGQGWYLPAIEELYPLYTYFDLIQDSLTKHSGTKLITSTYYFSSTEFYDSYAYSYNLGTGSESWSYYSTNKESERIVRAIKAL